VTAPVVALHGFSDSGACMLPFLRRLGRPDAATPALLGHGGRPMPPGLGFTHEALVADAARAVAALVDEAGAPAVLIGHSLGASTAAGVAASAPQLVALLVVEDPPWQWPVSPVEDQAEEQRNSHRPWLEGLQGTDQAGRLAWLHANHPGWPSDEQEPWAQSKTQVDLALFDAPQRWLRRTWSRVTEQVRCPTLLLVGEPAQGSACAAAVAAHHAQRGWTVERVAGAGHNVRRDAPERTAALVADWLASRRA
jgi:pimeloyl-ACP methyl ester carboxylesterase